MSRDQRPGRAVMVDSAREAPDSLDGSAAALADQPIETPPAAAKPRVLLPAILFLLACAGGAAGIALMPIGGL